MIRHPPTSTLFFFNDTATTEIYTLSLHDALPIYSRRMFATLEEAVRLYPDDPMAWYSLAELRFHGGFVVRSEEHTSQLQSHFNIVCRLLLEKKKRSHRMPSSASIKNESGGTRVCI